MDWSAADELEHSIKTTHVAHPQDMLIRLDIPYTHRCCVRGCPKIAPYCRICDGKEHFICWFHQTEKNLPQ